MAVAIIAKVVMVSTGIGEWCPLFMRKYIMYLPKLDFCPLGYSESLGLQDDVAIM